MEQIQQSQDIQQAAIEPEKLYSISQSEEKKLEEEIAKRDHRCIGKQQALFVMNEMSPGSAFFLPHGARIMNKLIAFMRNEYALRGYSEVISPNLFNKKLWEISGHWHKYQDNIFHLKIDEHECGLKPMNCPGHCLIFDSELRSYRDLPIRYAEFGVLHRNEVSGSLSGLARLRRFVQDDSHIFCRVDQIQSEVEGVLDLLGYVYELFGLQYKLYLSSRFEGALGEEGLWNKAEEELAKALDKFGKPWKLSPGDGAFYGPKIDVKVCDARGREFQCGSIQLDFVLPKRFNLQYRASDAEFNEDCKKEEDEDMILPKQVLEQESKEAVSLEACKDSEMKKGFERPVMIHRAIYGSLERFMAVVSENNAGKWPFWLSPRQIIVIPICDKKHLDYANAICQRLKLEGFDAEIDQSSGNLNKKIRNVQSLQFNFIAVVGDEEMLSGSVDLRERDKKDRLGKFIIPKLIEYLKGLSPSDSKFKQSVVSQAYYHPSEILDKKIL